VYIIVRFMAKILKAENIQTDILGSNGNGAFSLQRNNSSLLTLSADDRVGINTTAPNHLFEVRGSSTPKICITSDDQLIDAGATFRIDLKNASSQLFEGGNISVRHSASNQTAGAESTYMSFSTKNAVSLSERMRITPNGGIAFGGAANYGTSNHVLKSAGDAAPVWGLITNASVDNAAAIAYSKLSLGTSIVNADISASAAIAHSKLAALSSGNIMLGNSSSVATGTSVSGDITISDTGVTSITSGAIVNADINASAAIAYSKLSLGTSIVNADISASAGIVDTKLATISTASKVSNSATTATSANTASAIVARDASGNFSAGVITTSAGTIGSNANGNRTVTAVTSTPTGGADGDIVYVI
jgi:hypothetical protein